MSCPRCGADNQCVMAQTTTTAAPSKQGCAGDLSCWCFQVPLTVQQREQLPKSTSCYCATCLAALVQEIQV